MNCKVITFPSPQGICNIVIIKKYYSNTLQKLRLYKANFQLFCKSIAQMREKCENLDEIKKYYQWTFSRILATFH